VEIAAAWQICQQTFDFLGEGKSVVTFLDGQTAASSHHIRPQHGKRGFS
jgi:hypothetical protein